MRRQINPKDEKKASRPRLVSDELLEEHQQVPENGSDRDSPAHVEHFAEEAMVAEPEQRANFGARDYRDVAHEESASISEVTDSSRSLSSTTEPSRSLCSNTDPSRSPISTTDTSRQLKTLYERDTKTLSGVLYERDTMPKRTKEVGSMDSRYEVLSFPSNMEQKSERLELSETHTMFGIPSVQSEFNPQNDDNQPQASQPKEVDSADSLYGIPSVMPEYDYLHDLGKPRPFAKPLPIERNEGSSEQPAGRVLTEGDTMYGVSSVETKISEEIDSTDTLYGVPSEMPEYDYLLDKNSAKRAKLQAIAMERISSEEPQRISAESSSQDNLSHLEEDSKEELGEKQNVELDEQGEEESEGEDDEQDEE